jgi:hypothetical protein
MHGQFISSCMSACTVAASSLVNFPLAKYNTA